MDFRRNYTNNKMADMYKKKFIKIICIYLPMLFKISAVQQLMFKQQAPHYSFHQILWLSQHVVHLFSTVQQKSVT